MDIIVSVCTCRCVSVIEYILYILRLKWFSCFRQIYQCTGQELSRFLYREFYAIRYIFKCFCGKDKSMLAKISVIILQCIMYLEQINKFNKT